MYKLDSIELMSTPFSKLPISKFEVKRAVNWIIGGLIFTPFLIIFGSWVIQQFRGFGVLIFGYGSLLTAPVVAYLSFTTGLGVILRNPRGRTALKAFTKIWKEALFDAGSSSIGDQGIKSKDMGFIYRSFLRSVHPLHRSLSEQEITTYIIGLRNMAQEYFLADDAVLDVSCKDRKGNDFSGTWEKDYRLDFSSELLSEDSNTATVKGRVSIHYDKTCKVSDKTTYTLPVSTVHFIVEQQYVKCGEYWTPVDPLPEANILGHGNASITT